MKMMKALTLLCLVLSGVGALQVNIPQELYESARGDDITLPCSFTPKTPLKETDLVIISWSAEAAEAGAEEVLTTFAPSTPICKIQGKAEYGQNINLTCLSKEGSPPPTYKWESRDVRNMPRVPDPRTTDKGGILSLISISRETSGFYICTSSNKIRSATCSVTLSVMPPSMNIGPTARIIGGAVAMSIAVIIVICCSCEKNTS
ncbi:cell surface A33 antigen-like [Acanthopagrus schlegelii]